MLESCDCHGELGHWVEVVRASVDDFFEEFRDVRAGGPFSREIADLLLARDLAGQEKPEKTC